MPTLARSETLDAQLKALPDRPGVYLFHDRDGEVLYVGKAKSLRKRVQSYFRREAYATVKTAELVDRIEEIEFFGAGNEHEALLLEQNLIKRHRPPFNIRLRDDKSYPYIAVTAADEYPRVMFTRERHRKRRPLLRALLQRQEGARDAGRAEPRVPLPALRGPAAGPPLRRALPRPPHRPLRGSLRGPDLEGGLRGRDRQRGRVPVRPGAPAGAAAGGRR